MVNHNDDQFTTGTWRLDPDRTTITATATKLGFYSVPATLHLTEGTIEVDDNQRVTSVAVTADANSYTSKSSTRDRHVRGAKFLDSNSYPELIFRADEVLARPDGYSSTGTISVKGSPSPLRFEVRDVRMDGSAASFRAHATLDRRAIGLNATPAFVVATTIALDVDVVAHHST